MKNKKIIIIGLFLILGLCLFIYLKSHQKSETNNIAPEVKSNIERLKEKYQQLSIGPENTKYQQEYFDTFPTSFKTLNDTFGYQNNTSAPLYDESHSYITDTFFKLDKIEKSQYYNKMIDISLNGTWDDDAVNYFKMGVQTKLKSDINLWIELLAKHSDKEIYSFWYFYFDGPVPEKNIPSELNTIKKLNPKIYSIMENAQKDVLKPHKLN